MLFFHAVVTYFWDFSFTGLSERVADIKTRAQAMKCLTTFSEAVGPGFIFERVSCPLDFLFLYLGEGILFVHLALVLLHFLMKSSSICPQFPHAQTLLFAAVI